MRPVLVVEDDASILDVVRTARQHDVVVPSVGTGPYR
jgi:hypothetical protein